MTVSRGSPVAQVRLPEELKSWLQHEAIDNRRSLNSEIVVRLEQSRAAQQSKQPQGAAV